MVLWGYTVNILLNDEVKVTDDKRIKGLLGYIGCF